MLRKQILLLGNKKCFCLESKTFLLPGHKLLSVLTTIKMADCKGIEAGHAQKKEREEKGIGKIKKSKC